MNKETREIMKLKLDNLIAVNKSEYYKKINENLVHEKTMLISELDILYKRIELLKKYIDEFRIKDFNGKQGFKSFNGIDVCLSIINGTSNYAKIRNWSEYEDCEVLE